MTDSEQRSREIQQRRHEVALMRRTVQCVVLALLAAVVAFFIGQATATRDGLTGRDIVDACTDLANQDPASFRAANCYDATTAIINERGLR